MPLYRSQSALIYFVHIPKTGGSSVERALKVDGVSRAMMLSKAKNDEAGHGRCTPQHIHADVHKAYFPKGFVDYTFTVVRNPYARMASEYKMKVLDAGRTATPDAWIRQAFRRFQKFPFTRDNHIRPQVDFLAAYVKRFHLEDGLAKPIGAAFKALGLPAPAAVPHNRKGSPQKLQINKKTLRLIGEFYAPDFEKLQYDTQSYDAYFDVV